MRRIISLLLVIVTVLCLSSCGKKSNAELKIDDIHAICELATIKCYYNNVAQINKEKDNIFQKERKMWIEYEGEVVIGVDMSKVVIKISGDEVRITLPEAEVQSIRPINSTLTEESYICSTDGLLFKNKITTEEQQDAINKGQEVMKEAVLNDKALFQRAEDRAKELIESYITNLGNAIEKTYTIIWEN